MSRNDNIIVSKRTALLKKYTDEELQLIEDAVNELIESDEERGITSKLFYLDDKTIVQFVLRGHSVGRAFLQARQKFLTESVPRVNAIELKTISQFVLLGDPSLHLVKRRHKSLAIEKGEVLVESTSREKFFRRERRLQLVANGKKIEQSVEKPRPAGQKVPPARHRKFSKLTRENGFRSSTTAVIRFGDRKNREVQYSYIEKPGKQQSRRKPRIIVFKETGSQVDVRVYKPK